MATNYDRQYLIIVRAVDKDLANSRYALIDPDTGGDKTFDYMPLARTVDPTTIVAYGCITRATASMVKKYGERIRDLIDANRVRAYPLHTGVWSVETALADAWPGGLVFAQIPADL